MKRKSIFTFCAIALMLVLSLSVLTACNKNKHNFSSEWKNDEQYHWHECTTKKHTDTTEKLPHEFTWTEKTPAGVHTNKVEKGVCECGYETERTISDTATHTYGAEWKKDASGHWHDSTCDATAPTHDVMKGDFAAHTFDEGVETKPADYGVVGEKKFTCTVCGYEKTESIDALGAKDNEIVLAEGKTLGKEYDGEVVSITKGDFVIEGNREPAFMFKAKGADDNTYTATAPKKVGEYTVKVSVAATAEWKSATKTFDFAITPMVISVAWEPTYNNTNVFSGEPAELLEGEEAMITVTMSSANVGATVQSFEITGKDAGNYSLAIEDINVEIIKADIDFTISNADAFNNIYIGAQSIPDPTTNYVEIGTGYGAKTIVWEQKLEGGVWSRTLTKDEVVGTAGEYRVRIQYAEGDNYNFGATPYVSFTIKKESVLTIKNIIGPDGNPIAGITDSALGIKFGENRINMQAQIDGLCEYLTNTANAEKYFIIRVQCGETVIARFERRGVQTTSDLHYVYTYGGMSFDNDRVTGMHFDLFGANEYVSAEGKWIGNEDLEITIEITDSKDHPVLSKDSLQNSSSVGGGQVAVFEVQLPEGDGNICTFDVSWSGSPKNIEMVLYDAVTGSETSIVVKKVGENKFTFTETSGRKSFYLYVEELEATNNASGFTITASFETSTTRLEFPEGANELSSGELTYAAGEEKKFVIKVGAGVSFGMKYTISNIPAGATVKVYREDGTEVTLSTDNSFELLRNVPVRDYTIVVTNTTDSNLNINFSIKREQTSGTIVIS